LTHEIAYQITSRKPAEDVGNDKAFTPHQRPKLMALTKHNVFRCILCEAA
jgi:hypothetical protein